MLLVHRRHIIKPVKIRHSLQIGLVLHQLFGAPVQKADVWINAGDHLTVQLQHKAQHAMGRGVLRAKVDVEIADFCYCHIYTGS